MERIKPRDRGNQKEKGDVSDALTFSLLLIHLLCGAEGGKERIEGEKGARFSTPLKYGITLEIIARHPPVCSAVAT